MANRQREKVVVIVSQNASEAISTIPKTYSIWAADSEVNAEALRQSEADITTFPMRLDDNPIDTLKCYIDTIWEHHPRCSELIVIGVSKLSELKEALSQYGVKEFSRHEFGYRIEFNE